MKITNFAFAFAASLCIFTSCSNEADDIVDVDKDVKVKMVFGVGTQPSKSRTIISEQTSSAATVIWESTDKLTVFATGHAEGDTFNWKSSTSEGESHATFEGLTYQNGKPYYVLYPAQKNARLTDDGVTLNIPDVQTATKGSFDRDANIQLGKAANGLEGSEVQMANVCAYFYITVPENISRVTLEASNTDWHLAGTVTVGDSGSGGAMIKGFGTCTNKIELKNITESGTYFISFIPSSGVNSDLTVTLYTTDGDPMERTFKAPTNGFILYAGLYYNLGDYTPKTTPTE